MRREFCTLFDSHYLFKAVAMHGSLQRHCPSFRLTAFCFDAESRAILEELALDGLETVSLDELEAGDPELARVKPTRTPVEYCWTATPSLPLHVLRERSDVDEVTYLDADLLFFGDPAPVFAAMGNDSVLITPHRYAPDYAHHAATGGVYCVQFVTFRRDERGLDALQWWHDRCIEWCYYRLEDGKLGDQKYLDDWPERFRGVHVCEHKGAGLAPWNVSRYELSETPDGILVDDDPLIFFHYHRYRLRARGPDAWQPPGYDIDERTHDLVYAPYRKALRDAREMVASVRPGFSEGLEPRPPLPERLRTARADVAQRAVARAPWLLRARYPLRWRRLSAEAERPS